MSVIYVRIQYIRIYVKLNFIIFLIGFPLSSSYAFTRWQHCTTLAFWRCVAE